MSAPLVVHIVHRLGVGGLENGVVNLINHMPTERYRHAIICMTDYTTFRERITKSDVECFALRKRDGQDLGVYLRLWRLLRRLRPAIIHTRNIGTLECMLPAFMAGVKGRIHGEHGRDMLDLYGDNRRYIFLRRLYRPFVNRYIAVSRDLAAWLAGRVRIPPSKIMQIYNGVESSRFLPAVNGRAELPRPGFAPADTIVIGTVGRLQGEKDPLNLLKAFLLLIRTVPRARQRLRLVFVGDGLLRGAAEDMVGEAGCQDAIWFTGLRGDIPQLLRGFDIFVLPSLAEGISNTILEAMASGLPVVVTRVGGNSELVDEGKTGMLVPAGDPAALAEAITVYIDDPQRRRNHGQAGRCKIELEFSIAGMVQHYMAVYDTVLGLREPSTPYSQEGAG